MNELIEITAKDNHRFSAYISQPSGKPKAGIVIIQEIFGVNANIKEVTDLYASKGYLCIAPSLFDRIEKNVTLDYDENGISHGSNLKPVLINLLSPDSSKFKSLRNSFFSISSSIAISDSIEPDIIMALQFSVLALSNIFSV